MKFIEFTLRVLKLKKVKIKLLGHVSHGYFERQEKLFAFTFVIIITCCILLMTCFAISFQQSSKSFSCVLISLAAGSP